VPVALLAYATVSFNQPSIHSAFLTSHNHLAFSHYLLLSVLSLAIEKAAVDLTALLESQEL